MKKIIGSLGIVIASVIAFTATKNVNSSNDVKLNSLMSLNSANAECELNTIPDFDYGYCSFTGNCYWDPNHLECAPF